VIAVAAQPNDFAWLVERTQCAPTAGFRAIKAVDESGRIRGMVGYDGWTENAVTCHMAVDTPVAWRALVPAVFEYPFEQLGRGIMLGVIPAHNVRSWHLAGRFGFELTHRVRDGWAKDDDLLILELRRERCRYLEPLRKAG
jgi:RimJ/RimL family protein N-acetyltransferase